LLVLIHRSDADVADRRLELDQGMSVVVLVGGVCLAIGTEIRIVADGALVADTLNVGSIILVLAQRAIAVDPAVAGSPGRAHREGIVNGDEAVMRVRRAGLLDALGAVVPVRAVQALVADTIDVLVMLAESDHWNGATYLLATIADGVVANVASGLAEDLGERRDGRVVGSRSKGVAGMMAVPVLDMALDAEVVVVAGLARDKLLLG
jgi:hypothetical protein